MALKIETILLYHSYLVLDNQALVEFPFPS